MNEEKEASNNNKDSQSRVDFVLISMVIMLSSNVLVSIPKIRITSYPDCTLNLGIENIYRYHTIIKGFIASSQCSNRKPKARSRTMIKKRVYKAKKPFDSLKDAHNM